MIISRLSQVQLHKWGNIWIRFVPSGCVFSPPFLYVLSWLKTNTQWTATFFSASIHMLRRPTQGLVLSPAFVESLILYSPHVFYLANTEELPSTASEVPQTFTCIPAPWLEFLTHRAVGLIVQIFSFDLHHCNVLSLKGCAEVWANFLELPCTLLSAYH